MPPTGIKGYLGYQWTSLHYMHVYFLFIKGLKTTTIFRICITWGTRLKTALQSSGRALRFGLDPGISRVQLEGIRSDDSGAGKQPRGPPQGRAAQAFAHSSLRGSPKRWLFPKLTPEFLFCGVWMGLRLRLEFLLSVYIDFTAYCYFNLVTNQKMKRLKMVFIPETFKKLCNFYISA